MATEWYRNSTWDEAIEKKFEEKLGRARDKSQYLRIQADYLAECHPEVSLKLLDRYFKMPVEIDIAGAHVIRAKALVSLGRLKNAIDAYEAALEREKVHPNYITSAAYDLPYLIATRGMKDYYLRALEILEDNMEKKRDPINEFLWSVSMAIISLNLYHKKAAKKYAEMALEAAAVEHSGYTYHPKVGLVSSYYDPMIQKMKRYAKLKWYLPFLRP